MLVHAGNDIVKVDNYYVCLGQNIQLEWSNFDKEAIRRIQIT